MKLALGLFLFVFSGICCVKGQSGQQLVLYDGEFYDGNSVSIDKNVEDLDSIGFNNTASSLCIPSGLWLLYDVPSYRYSNVSTGVYWGENFCAKLPSSLNNLVSSVRNAGPSSDFRSDSITTYSSKVFKGSSFYNEADNPYFDEKEYDGSIIVTGRSAWTIYCGPSYAGSKRCVVPANITSAEPGLYSMGLSCIRSIRKGCFTDDGSVVEPDNSSKAGKIYF